MRNPSRSWLQCPVSMVSMSPSSLSLLPPPSLLVSDDDELLGLLLLALPSISEPSVSLNDDDDDWDPVDVDRESVFLAQASAITLYVRERVRNEQKR